MALKALNIKPVAVGICREGTLACEKFAAVQDGTLRGHVFTYNGSVYGNLLHDGTDVRTGRGASKQM